VIITFAFHNIMPSMKYQLFIDQIRMSEDSYSIDDEVNVRLQLIVNGPASRILIKVGSKECSFFALNHSDTSPNYAW
jgi:hypothetical protein